MDISAPKKEKAKRAPSKTPEQKQKERRERFVKLAPARTQKALIAMRNVARCGNKASYGYSPEDAAKILGALADALTEVQDAFSQKSSGKTLFTL